MSIWFFTIREWMCPAFLGLAQNEVLTVHRASIVHKHPIIAQILRA